MPGVPKSHRCNGCKRRKIKCDFNWPTCTPCKRTKLACSGPQVQRKWILSGSDQDPNAATASTTTVTVIEARSPPKDCRSSKTPSPELVEDNGAPWHAIRNKKHHFKGASYGFFRVAQQPLATAHDHLAAQLIYEIGEKSSGDAQLVLSYLRHLPVRLSQSRALFDSLTVFCDTWANYQRGDAPDKLINPRLYSRAIHTIQKAITGPLQLKAETLAAITTLQRMEILFDADRGSHRSIHYSGILALVQKKGPPNLEDALDVEIAIENQSTAVGHYLVHGGDNVFMAPAWQDSFHFIESSYCGIEASPAINHVAVIELASILNDWPVLVHALPEVYLNDDMEAAKRRAAELWVHVEKQLDRIRALGAAQIKDAMEGGAMYEVADPTLPLGVAYDFDLLEVWAAMISYYVTILIFMRMSYDLGLFLGTPDDVLYGEYRAMCSEATMVIPFIRRRGKLACKFFGPGMNIAYEGAEQADREYIRDFFIEANDYMHAPKLDAQTAHRYMIYAARCMTGRQSWDVSPGRKWSDYDKF